MKIIKNINSEAKLLPFVFFIMIFLMSCNYIVENKNGHSDDVSLSDKKITKNKQEARLLVKASQNSLDIIELCQSIENSKTEKGIEDLVEDLEKTHIEIFEGYKEMAQEKLISIPNYSTIEIQNKNIEEESFIETNLNLISHKINNQIECLNKLSKTTNSSGFKELSEKTNPILKSKLDKTSSILKNLKV